MPFYDHECEKCKKISNHFYPLSQDPEIVCPKCGGKTKRLMGNFHVGWERKMYKTFVNAEDERSEAKETDHMGPRGGYQMLPGEEL